MGSEVAGEARPVMVGVLRGARQVGKVNLEMVGASAAALVRATAEVGGDIAGAASGAVEGAMLVGRELGVAKEEAATVASRGALKAAGEIGGSAVERVGRALASTLAAAKIISEMPWRPRRSYGV